MLRRSNYTEPVLTSCEECNVFAGLFIRIYVFREILSASTFSCCSIYSPKLPRGVQRILRIFWLSLCLSRDSLFCDTHSLDLCILSKFIFLYLWYIPPRSCAFHTLHFTPNFSYVYFPAKYFYPWWRCSSELNYYFKFQQSKASF